MSLGTRGIQETGLLGQEVEGGGVEREARVTTVGLPGGGVEIPSQAIGETADKITMGAPTTRDTSR